MAAAENGGLKRRREGIAAENAERRSASADGELIPWYIARICEHGSKSSNEIGVGYVILDIPVSLLVLNDRGSVKRTTSLKWRIVSS